jgi:uncharacterized protein (DUF697 family)
VEKNWRFSEIKQCYVEIFEKKTCSSLCKTAIFRQFLGKNIFKIIISVLGSLLCASLGLGWAWAFTK